MSKRPQRRQPERSRQTSGLRREVKILLGLGGAVVLAAVAIVAFTGGGGPSTNEPSSLGSENSNAGPDEPAALIRDDSYRKGPADARVTLVEFLDPECEACGAMYPTVERILAEYEGRIQFVVRYFPLHRNSVLAARAYEAAGRQGKYWEMYSTLFRNQAAWGEKSQPQTELFLKYAQELGLEMVAFRTDFNDPAFEAKITRDKQDGTSLGVKGTPTFFLNGKLIGSVMSYEQLKNQIEAGLR